MRSSDLTPRSRRTRTSASAPRSEPGAKIGVRTYVGRDARVAVGSLIGDDETIADGEQVATDKRGLRLAA